MVSFRPLTGATWDPFQMGYQSWLVNGGDPNHLLYKWDDPPSRSDEIPELDVDPDPTKAKGLGCRIGMVMRGRDRLGGGNSNILYVHPDPWGKMNPFWRAYFSKGLVQPPTSRDPFNFMSYAKLKDVKLGKNFHDLFRRWVTLNGGLVREFSQNPRKIQV